jgi:hypothetical protein
VKSKLEIYHPSYGPPARRAEGRIEDDGG